MQTFPTAMRASATVGNETKLGEVCWHDSSIGLSGEFQVRSPKCTIGSHPSSTIVLPEHIAAATHLTLTFGKRFTLLKAPYPTRINGRLVREWLIDEPVEFCIGTCLFQVVPSAVAFKSTSVVRADQLVAAANRLSGPLPSSLSRSATIPEVLDSPDVREREVSPSDFEKTLSRFDSIETSLDQLRTFLGQIQEAVAKVPIDSLDLSASLAEEFSQLSQTLTHKLSTELQSQFEHRLDEREGVWNEALRDGVEVLESRIVNLAMKVESLGEMQGNLEETAMNAELRQTTSMQERFAGMESRLDEFANRFVEPASAEPVSGADLQEDWKADFENRFQELRIYRDEIFEALESVRNEVQQFGSVAQNNFEYLHQQLLAIPKHESPLPESPLPETDFSQQNFRDYEQPSSSSSYVSQTFERLESDSQQAAQQDYHPFIDPSYQEIEPVAAEVESSQTSTRDSFLRPNLEEYGGGNNYSSLIAERGKDSEIEEMSPPGTSATGAMDEPPFQADESVDVDSNVDIDALSERLRRMLSNSGGRLETQDPKGYGSGVSEQAEANSSLQSSLLARFQYENIVSEQPSYSDDSLVQSQPTFDSATLQEDEPFESQDPFARYEASEENDRQSFEQENSVLHSSQESTYESPLLTRNKSDSRESVRQPVGVKSQEAEEEDSIEVYMQKLLQRVKGGQESSSSATAPPQADSKMAPRSRSEFLNRSNRETQSMVVPEEASPQKTSMMTADEFVPRQQIPEKKNELDALRELANSNARRAITKSDSKKMNSAILLKIAITAFALAAALTLFVINGVRINPPFAGMIAALIVAILWGIDCLKHFRLLGTVKASETIENDRSMAAQQKNSQEQWRPRAD